MQKFLHFSYILLQFANLLLNRLHTLIVLFFDFFLHRHLLLLQLQPSLQHQLIPIRQPNLIDQQNFPILSLDFTAFRTLIDNTMDIGHIFEIFSHIRRQSIISVMGTERTDDPGPRFPVEEVKV